jgi:hypothetical protein
MLGHHRQCSAQRRAAAEAADNTNLPPEIRQALQGSIVPGRAPVRSGVERAAGDNRAGKPHMVEPGPHLRRGGLLDLRDAQVKGMEWR